jgi:hypothetical protein
MTTDHLERGYAYAVDQSTLSDFAAAGGRSTRAAVRHTVFGSCVPAAWEEPTVDPWYVVVSMPRPRSRPC